MKYGYLFLLCLWLPTFGQAQPTPTPASQRLQAYQVREELRHKSLIQHLDFQNIGPTVMSGRVVDIEAKPDDPTQFLVAYASGGLWQTRDNGISFAPLFEKQAAMTIGDIAADWRNQIIWIGTGENNSSRSSYAGVGMYVSRDAGKTWQHRGLEETHHIGRVVLHPQDTNTLWVAALGHLYTPNAERGIYKTTDGGKTWKKTLFVNDSTGAVELIIDPSNPKTLYAATWQRIRAAWDFIGNGKGSAIYKSTDAGETWQKLDFPVGEGAGRIGLALAESQPQTLYAVLDNQDREAKTDEDKPDQLTKDRLRAITKAEFLALNDQKINDFLDQFDFPSHHTAQSIKKQVQADEITPQTLVTYLEDANAQLFDTPVKGLECYRSDDGGKTWKKTAQIPDAVYSYGYYFGQVRVDAQNPEQLYTMGVPILASNDGGKTWQSINEDNVHVDHHALWVNPKRSGHLILGNDGGINISYDNGKNWFKANSIPVGQFYAIQVDLEKPYNVYGGLQDNGVWYGKNTYTASRKWHEEGQYPYRRLLGGDGMQVEVDTRTNNTIITGYQFGNYFRINKTTGQRTPITPKHTLGERPLRFNWQAPVHLSRHNQDILYMGSHRFHRSFDQGDTWQTLSDDLTQGGKPGNVPYGTLTSIHESPTRFGLIYVGSDDGLVHISRDAGHSWENISEGLPAGYWVSRVQASTHEEGRVYVSLNGYRYDDFRAMVFVSEDYGKSWQMISEGLPSEAVNVIREDPKSPDLLFVGTDHGLYISLDRGQNWMTTGHQFPAVAVHDLVIHPREPHLIVGTHGRSLYKADIEPLRALTQDLRQKDLHLFALSEITHNPKWGEAWSQWREASVPELKLSFFAKNTGTAQVEILTQAGLRLHTIEHPVTSAGLQFLTYDCTLDAKQEKAYQKTRKDGQPRTEAAKNGQWYLLPGTYQVRVSLNGQSQTETLTIKPAEAKPSRGTARKTP